MGPDESAAEAPYVPAVMRLRRALGPWLKRELAPANAVKRRYWWNRLFVQIGELYFYKGQSADEIHESLRPAAGRAASVLDEAQRVLDEERARGEHVERRATALQGAVAIAGSFALAGGLLLNASRLPAGGWRTAIAIAYLFTVLCLAATGLRALRATVRVHAFEYPDPEGPAKRAQQDETESQLRRAAELLYSYSRNQPIIDYQVAQMGAAGHWFATALAGVLITAALICGALIAPSDSSNTRPATTKQPRPTATTGACTTKAKARCSGADGH